MILPYYGIASNSETPEVYVAPTANGDLWCVRYRPDRSTEWEVLPQTYSALVAANEAARELFERGLWPWPIAYGRGYISGRDDLDRDGKYGMVTVALPKEG